MTLDELFKKLHDDGFGEHWSVKDVRPYIENLSEENLSKLYVEAVGEIERLIAKKWLKEVDDGVVSLLTKPHNQSK